MSRHVAQRGTGVPARVAGRLRHLPGAASPDFGMETTACLGPARPDSRFGAIAAGRRTDFPTASARGRHRPFRCQPHRQFPRSHQAAAPGAPCTAGKETTAGGSPIARPAVAGHATVANGATRSGSTRTIATVPAPAGTTCTRGAAGRGRAAAGSGTSAPQAAAGSGATSGRRNCASSSGSAATRSARPAHRSSASTG